MAVGQGFKYQESDLVTGNHQLVVLIYYNSSVSFGGFVTSLVC